MQIRFANGEWCNLYSDFSNNWSLEILLYPENFPCRVQFDDGKHLVCLLTENEAPDLGSLLYLMGYYITSFEQDTQSQVRVTNFFMAAKQFHQPYYELIREGIKDNVREKELI